MNSMTQGAGIIGRLVLAGALAFGLAACVSTTETEDLPQGEAAYEALAATPPVGEYRIQPLDLLSVNVFQEPEISNTGLRVTANGNIALPLAGEMHVTGLTSGQAAGAIRQRLTRYIIDPQVTVLVAESAGQRVTIEGEVAEPGVYPLTGRTGLLDLLAQAKGPTDDAKLDQAIVLRTIEGERYAAVFDIQEIRAGRAADPELRGGDQVVLGLDGLQKNIRQAVQASPFAAIFRPLLF